jgi:hypothetical protein
MVAAAIGPKVGDCAGPLDGEALLKALHHRRERSDVGAIARHQARNQELRDRPVVTIEDDPENHLVEMRPVVLRMAALAETGAAVALKLQAGGVEEGDRHRAQQRLAMAVEGLFDRIPRSPHERPNTSSGPMPSRFKAGSSPR